MSLDLHPPPQSNVQRLVSKLSNARVVEAYIFNSGGAAAGDLSCPGIRNVPNTEATVHVV